MIAYSQCWEDASLLIKALQIVENDVVLSVTSGGCNTLAIAGINPTLIYSIDSNYEQNYLLELKLAAIQNLSREKALELLGYRKCTNRIVIFKTIVPFLSEASQLFWQKNSSFIKKGIVHCGKFEKYLNVFKTYILPLVHGKQILHELVKPKSIEDRATFYEVTWNSFRWRLLFKIFFSKAVMSWRGRSKQMFAHVNSKSIATIYSNRVKHAFIEGVVSDNFYLNYILFNESRILPLYLENIDTPNQPRFAPIKILTQDVLTFLKSMPDNSISKFNLSDIFEPVMQREMDLIIEEIYRVATSCARLIFWNNLVLRDINTDNRNRFIREVDIENELKKQDKIFFYDRFYIYKIEKQ
jgi:S-adenosylmethionine-diacylglycerol 3-amino-3-carboxypropyl transferase